MDDDGGALVDYQIADSLLVPEIEQWVELVTSLLAKSAQVQPEVQNKMAVPPGAAGVATVLGRALPRRDNWSDPTWVRALYELPSHGVELTAFQAWAREAAAEDIRSISPKGALDDPAGNGFIEKVLSKGCCKITFELEEVHGAPTNLETVVDLGPNDCRKGKQNGEETTLNATAVTLPKDARKTWRVTGIRALAR